MKSKVYIAMFQANSYEAIVDDKDEFKELIFNNCDVNGVSFFYIYDIYLKKEVAINPKFVAYMEFTEVKE